MRYVSYLLLSIWVLPTLLLISLTNITVVCFQAEVQVLSHVFVSALFGSFGIYFSCPFLLDLYTMQDPPSTCKYPQHLRIEFALM